MTHLDDQSLSSGPSFADLELGAPLLRAIAEAGFQAPRPIQCQAIPLIQQGNDLIVRAQTGSGKSASFILPILASLQGRGEIEALVLVPTRELAEQVVSETRRLGQYVNVKALALIGGQSIRDQKRALQQGVDVIVATPGRLLDLLSSQSLPRFKPRTLVLDEADEMLDMGFIDDIRKIIQQVPANRQTLMFSATMPTQIESLASQILKDPIRLMLSQAKDTHADIEEQLYVVDESEREAALLRLIDAENPSKAVIFCRTKRDTDGLYKRLLQKGYKARALHGDLNQSTRLQVIDDMKQGHVQLLLATDVASRGLDIPGITHVFNYHSPESRERYVHRIGRTGRAGAKGIAMTIATKGELVRQPFFRQYSLQKFVMSAVPERKSVAHSRMQQMLERIQGAEVSVEIQTVFKQLLQDQDQQDLLLKLLSFLEKDFAVSGPEKIGYPPEQITAKALKAARPARSQGQGWRRGERRSPQRGSRSGRDSSFGQRRDRSRKKQWA